MIKTLFDNLNEFSANDFAEANKQIYDSGILCPFGESPLSTTALKVTNSSGNALIGNGSALIKGRVITVSGETVTLSTDGTYKIVLEWSAASDGSQLKALSGSATLVQTDTLYQILIATVVKSGTSLTITDGRSFINRMTDNQAIPLQTALQTGWTKVDVAFGDVVSRDPFTHLYRFNLPASVASVLQFGTKVKFTQDSVVKYTTVKSITVSGDTATIYFDGETESPNEITDFYCSNTAVPMGFPSGLSRDYLIECVPGSYYKYADGTLKCYGTKSITGACTKAWGNMFESDKMDFLPYPKAFTTLHHITITNIGTAAFIENGAYPAGQTNLTSPCSIYFTRPVSLASATFTATYEAIGRWK